MKVLDVHLGKDREFQMLLNEVGDFCQDIASCNVPFPWFAEVLTAHYKVLSPEALMLLVVDGQGNPCGHLIALVERPYGRKIAYCYQARLRKNLPENAEAFEYGFKRLFDWARSQQCSTLMMSTDRGKAWTRKYKAVKRLELMEWDLTGVDR